LRFLCEVCYQENGYVPDMEERLVNLEAVGILE
jgi:hypothetical protein